MFDYCMRVQIHGNVYFITFWCLPVLTYNVYEVCGKPAKLLYHLWSLGNKCSMKCQNHDAKENIQEIFYNVHFISNFLSIKHTEKQLVF